MSIFLNENSKVIVQGMTGSEGMKHTSRMLASGTAIVGGVNPRKAGTNVDFDGTSVPVFGSVADAMKETGADVSVIFVPPPFAKGAAIEAVDAQIGLAVIITEGIPVHDSTYVWAHAQGGATRIIGPNCPGLISPGRSNAGIILSDPDVKSVFVNVFGGITACDEVANGIVQALGILGDAANKPLVVRLDGNNVEEGRRILADANHPLVTEVDTMDAAADKAAELAFAGK